MPKVIATPEALEDVCRHLFMGQLKKLRIDKYKSGPKAGKLYAEYTLRDEAKTPGVHREQRMAVYDIIKRAIKELREGRDINFRVMKVSTENDEYTYSLSVKGERA